MKILKETFQSAEDKNVIASPLGALTLLSMYSAGAEGKSQEEILQLLGSSNYMQLQDSYSKLTERFSSMDPSYFVLGNKMYVSDKYTLNDQFFDVATQSYKSEVERVDFAQKKSVANNINNWANTKTNGYIKSPVHEDAIDAAAAVALFNVIFFQGHWKFPFDAMLTADEDFYVNATTTVKKPTMKLKRSMLYHNDKAIGARMVELPYEETGFRMVVVLPHAKDGLPKVVKKLAEKGILEDVFALRPAGRKIALEIPKFEIRKGLDLKNILSKVGVNRIFSEGTREVVLEEPVIVSKAFQEAFVKIDEEGAVAGAFTGFYVATSFKRMPPPPLEFKVDHPFLFVILHEDMLLFTGTYTH